MTKTNKGPAVYYQATILLAFFLDILLNRRRAILIEAPDDQMKPGNEIRIVPDGRDEKVEHPSELIAKIRTVEKVQVCTGVNTYGDDVEGYSGEPVFDERYLVEFDIEAEAISQAGFLYVSRETIQELAKMTEKIIKSKAEYNEDRESYLEEIVQQNIRSASSIKSVIYSKFDLTPPDTFGLFGQDGGRFSIQFTGIPTINELQGDE